MSVLADDGNQNGSGGRRQNPRVKGAALFLVIMLLIGLILSPRYLVYSDPPRRSDIIIECEGSEARFREARRLVAEGFADYLFIPASYTLYRTDQNRAGLTAIRFTDIKPGVELPGPRTGNEIKSDNFKKIGSEYGFPTFYEATHVEILMAKKAMDACGFRRAIFVSSPFHMRRIKIITDGVFDSSYDIKLAATRFEKRFEAPLPSQQDIQHVFWESAKMIWFVCYNLWDRWIGV